MGHILRHDTVHALVLEVEIISILPRLRRRLRSVAFSWLPRKRCGRIWVGNQGKDPKRWVALLYLPMTPSTWKHMPGKWEREKERERERECVCMCMWSRWLRSTYKSNTYIRILSLSLSAPRPFLYLIQNAATRNTKMTWGRLVFEVFEWKRKKATRENQANKREWGNEGVERERNSVGTADQAFTSLKSV